MAKKQEKENYHFLMAATMKETFYGTKFMEMVHD